MHICTVTVALLDIYTLFASTDAGVFFFLVKMSKINHFFYFAISNVIALRPPNIKDSQILTNKSVSLFVRVLSFGFYKLSYFTILKVTLFIILYHFTIYPTF